MLLNIFISDLDDGIKTHSLNLHLRWSWRAQRFYSRIRFKLKVTFASCEVLGEGKKNTSSCDDGKIPHIEFRRYLLLKYHDNNNWVGNSSVGNDLDVTLRLNVTWPCCKVIGKGVTLWCHTLVWPGLIVTFKGRCGPDKENYSPRWRIRMTECLGNMIYKEKTSGTGLSSLTLLYQFFDM